MYEICEFLRMGEPSAITRDRLAACTSIAEELIKLVQRWDATSIPAWHREEEDRVGVVAGLVHILATASRRPSSLDAFVTRALADPSRYGVREVLIPDVRLIYRWIDELPAARPAARRILGHCIAELRSATAAPIEPAKDWKREAKLGCSCVHCTAVNRFLRDAEQPVARFPLRMDLRQHLHQQIEKYACDLTHASPTAEGRRKTLVCTKTQATYERGGGNNLKRTSNAARRAGGALGRCKIPSQKTARAAARHQELKSREGGVSSRRRAARIGESASMSRCRRAT